MIDDAIILELLDKTPLFRGIPHKLLAPLFDQSVMISLNQGEQLLTPGLINEYVYIIISGQMSVHLTLSNLDKPFAILNSGECVGEMSVLVDSKVSAYVIAKSDCQLLAIGYSSFWALIKGSNESARNMLNILVQRIRLGNEVVADTLSHHDKFTDGKAIIDSLTGLYSQYGIQGKFERMLQFCTLGNKPLWLILLKIDETNLNLDSSQKWSGDQAFHTVAQAILSILKPDDCAARFNGNHFAILLANLQIADVNATAERLRATICQTPIRLPNGSSLPPVTISAGVCKAHANDRFSMLIARGRQALDSAINAGSNSLSSED